MHLLTSCTYITFYDYVYITCTCRPMLTIHALLICVIHDTVNFLILCGYCACEVNKYVSSEGTHTSMCGS